MFLSAALMLCAASSPVHVAIPSLAVSDVPAQRGAALVDFLAQRLGEGGGIRVTTPSEIQAVLGNERQKELLGCRDDTSCLAELSGALGADFLVIGSIARVGSEIVATLKCIVARDGSVRGAWSTRAVDEKALLDFLDVTAAALRSQLLDAKPKAARSPLRFLPVAAGALVLVTGVALWGFAFSEQRRLVNGDPGIGSADLAESIASRGRSIETTGWILGGVGLAVTALSLVFALKPDSDEAAPALTFSAGWRDGPLVGFVGRLP